MKIDKCHLCKCNICKNKFKLEGYCDVRCEFCYDKSSSLYNKPVQKCDLYEQFEEKKISEEEMKYAALILHLGCKQRYNVYCDDSCPFSNHAGQECSLTDMEETLLAPCDWNIQSTPNITKYALANRG